ncbi:MAG: 3-phosphoshikimate 1-carboxyvinyltransferase [Vicinamibacterales bacterium]
MVSTSVTVQPARAVRGSVRPPGDKSISHRYAMLAAVADGQTTINGYSTGGDCASTLACLKGLGVRVNELSRDDRDGLQIRVHGVGIHGLQAPTRTLDAGNSGSTMRMLAGFLAAQPFATTITGDASLRRRPMRRVIDPLERMGARVTSHDGRPPLTIEGRRPLKAIDFQSEVASAQVKSAVLFAGLYADGLTRVTEPMSTRDHTERALEAFGAQVKRAGTSVAIQGGQRLLGGVRRVPGDMSSAAFWMVAAAALPGSEVRVEQVGLNPTRTGVIEILRRLGARIDIVRAPDTADEPFGTVTVRHDQMVPLVISPEEVPGVIDELPVLAALATHGGDLRVSGAAELRVKESDRISTLADGLRKMGAEIEERADGFHVRGGTPLTGGEVDAHNDHRLAMAFAIAALGATGPTIINDAAAAAVSYPEFFTVLDSLRV